MSTPRLAARVADVRAIGPGRLDAYALAFDKPGRDGTGKANVRPSPGSRVDGVVWEIAAESMIVLDGFEPGYERARLGIQLAGRAPLTAWTYLYTRPPVIQAPSPEYVGHLLAGAREHALPNDLVARLEALTRSTRRAAR